MSLEAAIRDFMAARGPEAKKTTSKYRSTLEELSKAHPGYALRTFEPPAGTTLVRDFLDKRWGAKAPETYRAKLSNLHVFFEWHHDAGNISGDPTDGLTYPPIGRKPRTTITKAEAEALVLMNPDPRDQVPLRFLLTLGAPKDSLQRLQFRDLDATQRTVTFNRRGRHTVRVDDGDFWEAVEGLKALRRPAPTEFVLSREETRRAKPTVAELAVVQRSGTLSEHEYLWQTHDGEWRRSKLTPNLPRGEHGAHDWWYRCAWRAGVATPGVTRGFRMQSARYTVGRRRWTERGSLSDLAKHMGGLGSGGSASEVYRNPDELDKAIRRTRRRLRLRVPDRVSTAVDIGGKRPVMRWWKEPVRVFAEYVEDERNLIELSRVSVEMLRTEEATSSQLHDAAETLTRAVTVAELILSAEDESSKDHPLLHGHSLIAIWSALETMVGDLVETWLLWWPPARTRAASVVSLSALHGLPPDEWSAGARQLLDREYQKLNQKQFRTPRRLDNYEWLLDAVGLTADPQDSDAQLAQNLWDMQQVRNVFAHRRGVADARLVANSPHMPFNVRDQIRIGRHAWSDFLVTTVLYADLITRRMKRELGISDWLRTAPAPAIRYVAADDT